MCEMRNPMGLSQSPHLHRLLVQQHYHILTEKIQEKPSWSWRLALQSVLKEIFQAEGKYHQTKMLNILEISWAQFQNTALKLISQ